MNIQSKRRIKIALILSILVSVLVVVVFFSFSRNENDATKTAEKIAIEQSKSKVNDVEKVSSADVKVVELSQENCEYEEEKETVSINKYEGDQDCVIIPAEIDGKKVEKIEEDAFKECYNLETIKVPVELEDAITKIEYFEVNEENSDEEYIELTTTREYSETYEKFMSLPEEVQEKSAITPYKFEVYSTENAVLSVASSTPPSNYDIRDYIELEVEDQDNHGTCYAYAALSSLEIWIAKNRGELVDFSEIHAGVYGNGEGGIFTDIENYINSGNGPVWEADWDRWNYQDRLSTSDYNMINSYLSGTSYSNSDISYMQGLLATQEVEGKIESKSYLWPSLETIKQHVYTYGSVCAYYHHDNVYLAQNYNGYTVYKFHEGIASVTKVPDHAITIIGWDDNFSKYNFPESIRPDNNGAFLVLNSWGENWGTDGGCFWISYEDYWIDFTITGVTNVIGLGEEITLNDMVLKDADTGAEIEKINNMTNLVRRSIPVEINLDLRYTSNNSLVNANEVKITVRNTMENVNINPTVESKNGYIVAYLDTKTFSIGTDYIIDIAYKNEIISRSIRIIPEYEYEIRSDNTVKLTAYKGRDMADIVVPETYEGRIVRELSSNLFYNSEAIETLTIYSSIKTIGANIAPAGIILIGNANSATQTYANGNGYTFARTVDTTITGDFWSFDIASRTLNINGEMGDYTTFNQAPWRKFYRCVHNVKINTTIEKIGNSAFYGLNRLQTVSGTQNVSKIGERAFYNCTKLTNVGNLYYITDVGDRAFYNCSSLNSGVRLVNAKTIGNSAFYKCSSLTSVGNLPNLTTIGSMAFYKCTSLVTLSSLTNLTTIGIYAFEGCTKLSYVQGLTKIEKIGAGAFYGCSDLQYVLNLNTVKEIGYRAFDQCVNLSSIGSLENVEIIGSEAFSGCTKLENIQSLEKVKTIGDGAFQNCSSIEDVLYLRNVTTIGWDTFNGCTGITKIYIGKTIQSIAKRAFEGCNLTMYGHANTRAETYATEYSIPFVYINVTAIEVKENPTKTTYIKGEDLDLTNGTISVTYEDGTVEDISMTNESVQTSGYDATKLGEQTVTLTYQEKTAALTVKVTNDVISIQIEENPTKTTYIKGNELDLTGGKVLVTYQNKETKEVDITDQQVTVSGYDKTKVGEQTLTVTYDGKTTTFTVKVTNDVTKLQVKSTPSKLKYIKGEDLDLTGGKLRVTFQDETTTEILMTNEDVTVSGYDKTNVAAQEVIVEYGGRVAIFTVNVTNDVTGIEIKETPIKTKYLLGKEDLDLTGGEIFISYQDKTKEQKLMTDEDVQVIGYDKTKLGEQEITVKYKEFSEKFKVEVTNPVAEITIQENPSKTTYIKGEELNLSNGKILVTYEDGKVDEISLEDKQIQVTGYDKTLLGKQVITLTYRGEIVSFTVEVTNDVTGIEVKETPNKKAYIKGEDLDLIGGVITLIYQDKTTEEKLMSDEEVKITGYNKTLLGEQEITVQYKEFVAVFTVKVTNNITGIKIKETPSKTTYIKGEELDLTGGKLLVTYEDKTTEEKLMTDKDVQVTGYNKTKLGKQEISITYKEYTGVFAVEVTNNITGIQIKSTPSKLEYIKGEVLDLSGGKLLVTYEDKTTEEKLMSDEDVQVTGYDKITVGEQNITVKYKGYTVEFSVKVTNNTTGMQIKQNPTKTTYIKGEELDLTSGKLLVKYEDKTTEEVLMTNEAVEITGYDKTKVGEQKITVRYKGYTAEFTIKVTNNTTGMQIKQNPTKILYTKGEELDLTGGKLLITYEDKTIEEVLMTNEAVKVTGYDKTKVGEQKITTEYLGYKVDFKITVLDQEKFSAKLNITGDSKVEAGNQKTINLAIESDGAYINTVKGKLTYDNNILNVQVKEKNGWKIGYNPKTGEIYAIKTGGAKSEEIAEITYTTKNNITAKSNIAITDINFTTTENKTVSGTDISKEINIEVPKEPAENDNKVKTLVAIELTRKPNKTNYKAGEEFDTTGMVVTAKYSDGTKKVVKNYLYTPHGALDTNDDKIIINYVEGEVAKIAYCDITVEKNNTNNNNTNMNNNSNHNNANNSDNKVQNEIKNNNTNSTNNLLPQTGIQNYIIIAIIVLLIGIASLSIIKYVEYRRYH